MKWNWTNLCLKCPSITLNVITHNLLMSLLIVNLETWNASENTAVKWRFLSLSSRVLESFISSSVGTHTVEQIVGLRFKPNDASLSQDRQLLPEITEMKLRCSLWCSERISYEINFFISITLAWQLTDIAQWTSI